MTAQAEFTPNTSSPLLSVIIPAIDADVELRRCVDSIHLACGNGPECEVLIVMPPARIEHARKLLQGVSFVAERRRGIYAAMNDGLAAARGRYLYFIGKDDIVLPPFAEVLKVLREDAPSSVFCDVYWGSTGIFTGRPSRWRVLLKNFCHQGIVYSREALEKHGPYLRKMRVQADHFVNIKVLWDRSLGAGPRYVPGARVWYSGDGFSSVARDPVFWRLYPVVMRRYVGAFASWLLIASRKVRGR
ncbi:glycosyltransferase [Piscinibacter gummiphilus]|uniref:glycosyltransferase n=1 Tax=Piscinibacter gummiphilus TaxID=946333 RepID=UPI000A268185|nr:glycosyltransferase [Piscinibacter gummiphilus]ATU67340.1 hypothetical protein CPZ87_23655 [Piscinibacter gummiphilus]